MAVLHSGLDTDRMGPNASQITEVVTDPSGGLIANANVTVTNPQTGFIRQVQTNTGGNCVFPTLQPGVYSIKVESQGFQARSAQ